MLKSFFSDEEYFKKLYIIGLPLIIQQVVTNSVNLIDTLMIGSFGDVSLAAVNLCNQFYFFFYMLIYGANAGGSILNAQFWGNRDKENLHRVMGLQFISCFVIGLIFSLATFLIPDKIISLYSDDPFVIETGVVYIRTLSVSYFLYAISQVFLNAHRSIGNTQFTMKVAIGSLFINIMMNYVLIFGKFGFPELGVSGAAIATLLARCFEFILTISFTYLKKMPVAASFKSMFDFRKDLTKTALKKMIPVTINEGIWGAGTNAYSAIYAGISTSSIAAYGAVSPIDTIAFTLMVSIGDATGVIVGNLLGANQKEKAYQYGRKSIFIGVFFSFIIGAVVILSRNLILGLYNLSPEAIRFAEQILLIMALSLWARGVNYTIFMGALRAGGDTTFCLLMDAGIMWMIGIPTAWILANVFHFTVPIVYLGLMTEEAIKLILIVRRFRSKKWVTNLVG